MSKTAKVTLAGIEYTVHAFNIGELEEIAELVGGNATPGRVSFQVLKIALRRAEPKIEDPNAIEAEPEEIKAAFDGVLELAGLKQATENPPA